MFINEEKGVATADDALAGARDIIAEWVNEDAEARAKMRDLFVNKGVIRSKVLPDKLEAGIKYKDYYDWEEPVATAPSHRILAMRRGEREEFLTLRMTPPEEEACKDSGIAVCPRNRRSFASGEACGFTTVTSVCCRLSMETETRLETKKRADETAIRVFADNLRQLLLAPPAGQKAVLAIDPGFRTGCKTVCLDRQGKLLHSETIYPLLSEKGREGACANRQKIVRQFSD